MAGSLISNKYWVLKVMSIGGYNGVYYWNVDELHLKIKSFHGSKLPSSTYYMELSGVDRCVTELIKDGFITVTQKATSNQLRRFGLTHFVHKCETAPVAEVVVADIEDEEEDKKFDTFRLLPEDVEAVYQKGYNVGLKEGRNQFMEKAFDTLTSKYEEGYKAGHKDGFRAGIDHARE
jgi:hypothetical protein